MGVYLNQELEAELDGEKDIAWANAKKGIRHKKQCDPDSRECQGESLS